MHIYFQYISQVPKHTLWVVFNFSWFLVSGRIIPLLTKHKWTHLYTSEMVQFTIFSSRSKNTKNSIYTLSCASMLRLAEVNRGRPIGTLDACMRIWAVAAALHVDESSIFDLIVLGGNLTGLRNRDEVLQPDLVPLLWLHSDVTVAQAFLDWEYIQTLPRPLFSLLLIYMIFLYFQHKSDKKKVIFTVKKKKRRFLHIMTVKVELMYFWLIYGY